MMDQNRIHDLIEGIAQGCDWRKDAAGIPICDLSGLPCLRTIEMGDCAKLNKNKESKK